MKECRKCGRVWPLSEFQLRSVEKGTYRHHCKACRQEYQRGYYEAHSETYKRHRRKNMPRYRRQNQRRFREYLIGKACVDCGEFDPIVLEFDHVRGVKTANISEMVNGGVSWNRIMREIEKCEIRCANCHRRKTVHQLKWFNRSFGA